MNSLFKSRFLAVAELDKKGKLLDCSTTFARMLQAPKSKLLKKSIAAQFKPVSSFKFRSFFNNFLNGKSSSISEVIQLDRKPSNGSWLDLTLEKMPEGPDSEKIYIYLQDVTEFRQRELSLVEKEGLYKTVIANAQAVVFALDDKGCFLFSEGMGLADLGLKPGEVVGLSALELYKHNSVIVKSIKAALQGKPFSGIFEEGGLLFDTSLVPYFNSQKKVTAVIGMSVDISERKRAEKALIESEEKYRSIFESFTDVYFRAKLTGEMTMVSPSVELNFGYSPAFALRQKASLFFKDSKGWNTMVRKLLKEGELRNFEFEAIDKEGDLLMASLTVSLTYDKHIGNPDGVEGVLRDITELKMAEKEAEIKNRQLMQASKMVTLGTLVSGVAHEINNPNNYIMFNTSLLSKIWSDIEPILAQRYEQSGDFKLGGLSYKKMLNKYRDLIEGINDGAHRINKIVTELKNFVRQGSTDLNQKVDINQVVLNASNLIKNLISESKVKLEMDLGWELPLVKGNRQQLEQVVINLLENSCQAAKNQNCYIKVQTIQLQNPDVVQIKVTDNGPGIPKEIMHRIMDPFFTTKSDLGGTGMGLSISYNIIEDHRGNLEVSSVPNSETVFTVSFPVQ